ncbi:MAG: sensor domain-containing diguanylate cyclase [Rhodospirillaceae bacterium]|nr:sensor domain-containing diguanylate cyclase [Rhodospirillaceae bacterium]
MSVIRMALSRIGQWRRAFLRSRLLWVAIVLAFLVGGTSIIELLVTDIHQREEAIAQGRLISELSTMRARLESEINASIYRVQGLIAFVAVNPSIDETQFRALAAEMVRDGSHIRNIGLAPGNVLRFIFPRKGNEGAIGLDYRETPSQWPDVKRAMALGQTVITGPIRLVQGGTALVARTPIYAIRQSFNRPGERYYWGMGSIVLSDSSLFAESFAPRHSNAGLAVRNSLGVLFGDPAVFDEPSVVLPVRVPGDYWEIAAMQTEPPTFLDQAVWETRLLGYGLLAILLVVFVLLATSYRRRMQDSLEDALTGLPNRRLLINRLEMLIPLQLRRGGQLYVLFVDLDGFKPVNDSFGHAAGDHLLVALAKRLRENTRRNDTVARTGGDEFIVALPDIASHSHAEAIAAKLRAEVFRTVDFNGHQISVGCSIGMASVPADARDMDTLLSVADQRMYAIKQQNKRAATTA